mmetsp:Transcript_23380/g.55645  ORF Transcript_23380/g.55645 Transcript_23380/m.55645 type:complete len:203 (-) Transcript_23380:1644-2252(-)
MRSSVAGEVLSLGQWSDQAAHIELYRELALVPQRSQAGQRRRQRVPDVVGQCLWDRRGQDGGGQVCLRQRQPACRAPGAAAPDCAVEVVVGVVCGDECVAVVVPAIEEHAHEGLVVGRRRCCSGCIPDRCEVQRQRRRDTQTSRRGSTLQEEPPGQEVRSARTHVLSLWLISARDSRRMPSRGTLQFAKPRSVWRLVTRSSP